MWSQSCRFVALPLWPWALRFVTSSSLPKLLPLKHLIAPFLSHHSSFSATFSSILPIHRNNQGSLPGCSADGRVLGWCVSTYPSKKYIQPAKTTQHTHGIKNSSILLDWQYWLNLITHIIHIIWIKFSVFQIVYFKLEILKLVNLIMIIVVSDHIGSE